MVETKLPSMLFTVELLCPTFECYYARNLSCLPSLHHVDFQGFLTLPVCIVHNPSSSDKSYLHCLIQAFVISIMALMSSLVGFPPHTVPIYFSNQYPRVLHKNLIRAVESSASKIGNVPCTRGTCILIRDVSNNYDKSINQTAR